MLLIFESASICESSLLDYKYSQSKKITVAFLNQLHFWQNDSNLWNFQRMTGKIEVSSYNPIVHSVHVH